MKRTSVPALASRWIMAGCLLALLLGFTGPARAQVFQWAQSFPVGAPVDFSNSVTTDAAGNTYFGGMFDGNLQIGSFSLSAPGMNLFVAKLNQAGSVTWVKHFPNPAFFEGAMYDLQVDASGNVYVTGSFEELLLIDGDSLDATNSLGPDFFLAKLDAAGNVQWYQHGSGDSNDEVMALALDGSGNIYLSGYSYSYQLYYDGDSLQGGVAEAFLIKTDPNGNYLWGQRFEANDLDMAVKSNGDGYITGSFSTSTLDLGNGVTVPHYGSPAYYTGFLAAFNAAGQFQWANQIGGDNVQPVRVRATPAGEPIVAGVHTDNVHYGSTTITGSPNSEDMFLLKTNASGSLLWSKNMANFGLNLNFIGFASGPQMELDAAGNPVLANAHQGPVQLSPTVTHTPLSGNSLEIVVAKYLANGNLAWSLGAGGPATEVLTGMGVAPNGSVVLSGGVADSAGGMVTTQFGTVSMSTNGEGAFLARIMNEGNQIGGSVFVDLNSSGTRDAGEPGAPYVKVALQTGQSTFTDAVGNFSTFTDTGTYQITLPQPPSYYTVSPGSHTATFAGVNLTDTTNHFALQPQGPAQDLRIDVAQVTPPRPGFVYRTRLTYRNVGTSAMSGTVKLLGDTALTMLTATPVNTGLAGDTLLWSFTGLQPMESRNIMVEWQVPVWAMLGDTMDLIAMVTPTAGDQTASDNTLHVKTPVQGSFDPNDKLVSHRRITPTQVQNGQWLTYTVRFQNTGTDTAFFARIEDELSTMLDMSTLQVVSASHSFTMQLTGPTSVKWDFGTILLPDSGTNEPASHGYIQYRIKPLNTLQLGDHINTHANIFFDFNAPVMTNITDTEVGFNIFMADADKDRHQLRVWPNPSSGRCLVQVPGKATGPLQIRVLNSLGQEVNTEKTTTHTGSRHELQLEKLPDGMYLLQVQQGSRLYTSRIVLQR